MRYDDQMNSQMHWVISALISVLLTAGCGPSAPRISLHSAVEQANYGAVRQHIGARSDLNAKNSAGWTALHLAAMKGDLPMIRLLAEAGADPARTGPAGKTPADLAREKGQTAIVQYLESKLASDQPKPGQESRGRRLIDGGLGVSDALDAQ